jgi:hypothetical protein
VSLGGRGATDHGEGDGRSWRLDAEAEPGPRGGWAVEEERAARVSGVKEEWGR